MAGKKSKLFKRWPPKGRPKCLVFTDFMRVTPRRRCAKEHCELFETRQRQRPQRDRENGYPESRETREPAQLLPEKDLVPTMRHRNHG
jgi:hypothetical protein